MRVLIAQPVHEEGITQLENDIKNNKKMNIDIVLYPEGYLSTQQALEKACNAAKENHVMIITSYRKDNKDIGVIISSAGEKILERAKTPPEENVKLNMPLSIPYKGTNIGYLLCMELLKDMRDIKSFGSYINFIAHPIGVD